MKTHGLMFKDAMVRAIIAGQKTQTRRLLGTFYAPGDRICVKEAYRPIHAEGDPRQRVIEYDYRATYQVGFRLGDNIGGPGKGVKWKSSMFMPRSAARLWLEITDARVERLQAISEADAIAEGADHIGYENDAYRRGFCALWQSIHGDGSWRDNPEVRVITFRRITV